MPTRLEPDDEVRRFQSVWLKPPWHARYSAYGVFVAVLAVIVLVEAVTPLTMRTPPVWEVCIAVFITTLLMGAVDHDKPVRAVLTTTVRGWAKSTTGGTTVTAPTLRRTKITREPL